MDLEKGFESCEAGVYFGCSVVVRSMVMPDGYYRGALMKFNAGFLKTAGKFF